MCKRWGRLIVKMTDRITRTLLFGLSIAVLGITLSLLAPALKLEENAGLDWLFKLRGARPPPEDVVLVNIDNASAEALQLPNKPGKWPRSLHARLIQELDNAGASVIAFDVIFDTHRIADEDKMLASAVNRSGKVILFEYIKKKIIPFDDQGLDSGEIISETLVAPIPELADSALALAPFPLPVVPVKVSQYWAFKTSAGETPTLPVVTFQAHALSAYAEFLSLLAQVRPDFASSLPSSMEEIIKSKQVNQLVLSLRRFFKTDSQLADDLLERLDAGDASRPDSDNQRLVRAMIDLYQSHDTRYLNYYGPPRAITTIPYYRILALSLNEAAGQDPVDLHNKAVFVGFSEQLQYEQQDGFYSVYSQDSGLNLSGVEIAATAFANILDRRPVMPVTMPIHFLLLLVWGVVIGTLCLRLSAVMSITTGVGLGVIYLLAASRLFTATGTWIPLVIPLLIQLPVALFASTLMKFIASNRERKHIRKAFGYHLPENVVNQLVEDVSIQASTELAHGVCLVTDAEQYTRLSETMPPDKLGRLMNRYYETLFQPVKRHQGIVSDVVGDSMMAVWAEASPVANMRKQACEAALEISQAVTRFNAANQHFKLPTRIGLHCGEIMLGHIGAIDHYEYRAVGDIVNTASRVQGLNKQLGTNILVTETTIQGLDWFQTRKLGSFLLSGKAQPLVIYELMGLTHQSSPNQQLLCTLFAEALSAFINRDWQQAEKIFHQIMTQSNGDKPSQFYLTLCKQYAIQEPEHTWEGVVSVYQK